jgi:hypothetical protein
MKVKFEIEKGYPYLIVKYEDDEWTKIENILKSLGLQKAYTEKGFGKNLKFEYYRENDTELLNYLKEYFYSHLNNVVDDINDYIYYNGYFNIAIFRVIPNQNNEVKILLDKYLTIYELKKLFEKIKELYEILLNIALKSEANISIEE